MSPEVMDFLKIAFACETVEGMWLSVAHIMDIGLIIFYRVSA